MGEPILSSGTSRLWIDVVNPTTDDNVAEIGNFWFNTSTGALFFCTGEVQDNIQWVQITTA